MPRPSIELRRRVVLPDARGVAPPLRGRRSARLLQQHQSLRVRQALERLGDRVERALDDEDPFGVPGSGFIPRFPRVLSLFALQLAPRAIVAYEVRAQIAEPEDARDADCADQADDDAEVCLHGGPYEDRRALVPTGVAPAGPLAPRT
jgi:hypothetical protein